MAKFQAALSALLLGICLTNNSNAFSVSSWSGRSAQVVASSSSFVGTGRHALISSSKVKPTARRQGTSAMSMVIDKLSDDCIAAVKESHDIGNEMGMTELTKELLFAGIVRQPERARKTLSKYDIQSDEVKEAAIQVLKYAPGITLQQPPAKEERKPLPFSSECKLILNRACTIAESMESSVTRSEHVLLALLGYNNGKKIDNAPVVNVLQKMKSLGSRDSGFKIFNFCEDLVNDLPLTPYNENDTTVKRETVVVGKSDGNTNTLAEVGVDMTQMALEGKYDAVYGRNEEIRSILRTLGRRRKNNPCLIGGKKLQLVSHGLEQTSIFSS